MRKIVKNRLQSQRGCASRQW